MNNIDLNISGIKCDAPGCDFINESVKMEDYKNWVNRPCPKCGANLLTQADLDAVNDLVEKANYINSLELPEEFLKNRARMEGSLDGSGIVKWGDIEPIE